MFRRGEEREVKRREEEEETEVMREREGLENKGREKEKMR